MRTSKFSQKKVEVGSPFVEVGRGLLPLSFFVGGFVGARFACWPAACRNMLHLHLTNADAACFHAVLQLVGIAIHGACC